MKSKKLRKLEQAQHFGKPENDQLKKMRFPIKEKKKTNKRKMEKNEKQFIKKSYNRPIPTFQQSKSKKKTNRNFLYNKTKLNNN